MKLDKSSFEKPAKSLGGSTSMFDEEFKMVKNAKVKIFIYFFFTITITDYRSYRFFKFRIRIRPLRKTESDQKNANPRVNSTTGSGSVIVQKLDPDPNFFKTGSRTKLFHGSNSSDPY